MPELLLLATFEPTAVYTVTDLINIIPAVIYWWILCPWGICCLTPLLLYVQNDNIKKINLTNDSIYQLVLKKQWLCLM